MHTLISILLVLSLILLYFYLSSFVLYAIKIIAVFAFKKATKSVKKTVPILLVITTVFFLSAPSMMIIPLIFAIYLLNINTQIVAPEDSEIVKKPISSDAQELIKNLMSLPCEKGIRQFNLLDRKMQSFKVVISAQLDANELTFIRYTDSVEQVYFEVLRNLQQHYLVMTSIKTINESHLAARLMSKNAKNEFEIETLRQRLDLWGSQMNKADNLLIQNEQTLSKLDLITSQIANIELKNIRTR